MKLFQHWQGPYIVCRKSSPGVYVVQHSVTGQKLMRNVRLLRIYKDQISERKEAALEDQSESGSGNNGLEPDISPKVNNNLPRPGQLPHKRRQRWRP